MILSAFISLYLYPKHTNVYKTVIQISSKSKWFVRSPEIRLRRSWLYLHEILLGGQDAVEVLSPDAEGIDVCEDHHEILPRYLSCADAVLEVGLKTRRISSHGYTQAKQIVVLE